jgi:putative transposase
MGQKGWHSRGYLPHYDGYNISQHVVFRLYDSVPAGVQSGDDVLDQSLGCAVLWRADCAKEVVGVLSHGNKEGRYELQAWCVMPNHVHVLLATNEQRELGSIVRLWKSYSAAQINKILMRSGRLWAADYFDRYIRDQTQFETAKRYIEMNPVVAGLCDKPESWAFSSAAMRA